VTFFLLTAVYAFRLKLWIEVFAKACRQVDVEALKIVVPSLSPSHVLLDCGDMPLCGSHGFLQLLP
jgi:hypothetical protein